MKKLLIIVLSLVLSTFALSGCGQKAVENAPSPSPSAQNNSSSNTNDTIKVAVDATYRPMEWVENGETVGFDIDLMKAIAKQMGKKVEFSVENWDDIFDKLYAKKYDAVMSSVTITDDRKKTMLFSDPYFDNIQLIVAKKASNIKQVKDLSKKKVVIQSGTTSYDLISQNIAGVTINKFDKMTDVLAAFENKDVDALVTDSPIALDFVKQKNNPDYEIVKDSKFFTPEQFGIAANKDNTVLIEGINAALKTLKANGEYDKIYKKYF